MATSVLKQLPKATVELTITIPWFQVQVSYEKMIAQARSEMEVPGFRKGKAPNELTDKNIDKARVYEQVIREIVPKLYAEAIKEHNLIPITSPKIDVLKAKEKEDWLLKATVPLKPKISLKNYKEKIKILKKTKPKIWTPGTDTKKEEEKKYSLDDLLKIILEETEVELSDMLVTDEANRLLADLIDQTKKLGLTVEQYLIAKSKTTEQIKAEYAKQAEANLKIQFILAEIADQEKIAVTQEDLAKMIEKVENPEEREKLKNDSYYLAHLLRQQKTLDFLSTL